MKFAKLLNFFAVIFFFALSVNAQKPSAKVEKELIKIQNDWAEARVRRDVAFLEKLYAAEFHITNIGGNVVERAADIVNFTSGDLKPEIVKNEEMKVALYGKTAIVTGIEYVKGTYKNFPGEFWMRFTNIYIHRSGGWQMVSHHSTEIRNRKPKP